jgi:hypothetical protein
MNEQDSPKEPGFDARPSLVVPCPTRRERGRRPMTRPMTAMTVVQTDVIHGYRTILFTDREIPPIEP